MAFPQVRAGAEPFYFAGSGPRAMIGCLVLHGFSASPQEVHELGAHLGKAGYTVLGPRLAGHGTDEHDLNRARWWDWYNSALDGYHLLRQHGVKHIIAIGLSTGAATALLLATNEPLLAVVSLSTPLRVVDHWRTVAGRYAWWLSPTVAKSPLSDEFKDRVDYRKWPVRGVGQFGEYVRVVEAALPDVTVPTLLMHARNDDLARPESMRIAYDGIGSSDKRMVWLDNNTHVMTCDNNRAVVFREVTAFVSAQSDPQLNTPGHT